MRELPGTCHGENGELDEGPADNTGVGGFGLVAELGLAFLEIKRLARMPECNGWTPLYFGSSSMNTDSSVS